ncbi:MAG: hypothetical protein EH225_09915 [Calditrichaeota bacterium]|nr:hypothetical protein [Spirochaetales bacterium]RQW01040.1 MAG: hypothetical protein EH225_09915 [Calditrichota bacterium]
MDRSAFFLLFFFAFLFSHHLEGEENFYLGIAWVGSSEMSEEITKGTMELLSELVPDLIVELQSSLSDEKSLDKTMNKFIQEKDAVILMGQAGLQYASDHQLDLPLFLSAINNPVQADLIRNIERPGGNVTGVSYFIDYGEILSFIKNFLPELDSVLLLYEKNNPASDADLYYLTEACRKESVNLYSKACSPGLNMDDVFKLYYEKVDAVIFGNQNFFFENLEDNSSLLLSIPSFSLDSLLVRRGVLASLAPDYLKLGRLLAGSIIGVLYNGKKTGDIPFGFDKDPRIHLNMSTAESLGIIVPLHILRVAEVYR